MSGLYIALIHVHGLTRGTAPELGRDADTGGQTKYVLELARALAGHPDVERVDLITRQVIDPKVDPIYGQPIESIAENAYIVRLPFGPRRYLRKEKLWPHLDSMADKALKHIRETGRVPDVIHSHYADAGYVGARLAGLLGVPQIHTGHSLGREKQRRLLDQGVDAHVIQKQYNIHLRIEAEEAAMDSASLVIASTRQEVENQYSLYDNYHPRRMVVIPPGIDLSRFGPPRGPLQPVPIRCELNRFLRHPGKPIILALSRADERKNIRTLVRAYGENAALRDMANLVIIAGNREVVGEMERASRQVLTALLMDIDRYDLYGRIAYPKHHTADDVPELFRLAARSHGVFVNPALTEPFGLTLIEASASGLPVVATEDGGPRDIIANCRNGLLIDPLDAGAMGEAILSALSDRRRWRDWARNGLRGVRRHYAWQGHVENYLKAVRRLVGSRHRARLVRRTKTRLLTVDRLVVCDIDGALLGDREGLNQLMERLGSEDRVGFGIATGRRLKSALKAIRDNGIPMPDLLITGVGTEIFYRKQHSEDREWQRHICYRWEPERLRRAMKEIPGVRMQPKEEQCPCKLSYLVDPDTAPRPADVVRYLRSLDLHASVVYSHQAYLDLLPIRASKGQALRYLGAKWGIAPEQMLVAGNSGNDVEMLRGDTLGVVVGNRSRELRQLEGEPRIYFAEAPYAWGVLEGIDHYNFLAGGQVSSSGDEKGAA